MKSFAVFKYRGNDASGAIEFVNVLCEKIQSLYVGTTTQLTAAVSLNSDGTITLDGVGSPGTWHNTPAAGLGASFWVIVTLSSGSLTSGTAGSRVALTAGQTFSVTTTGSGTSRIKSAVGTIQIWDAAAAGNMVSSGTFELRAQVQANVPISQPLPPDTGGGNESTPYQPV